MMQGNKLIEITAAEAIAWLTEDKAFGQECYSRKQIAKLIEQQHQTICNLQAERETLQEKIKFMEQSCLQCVDVNDVNRKIAELQANLNDANETLYQRYIDENETVWTIPTPEAYAIVCKKMHGLKTTNELLRIRLRDYKAWIQKHRTDRRLKWIDVNNAMPKPGENCVVLFDNGIVDVGYLGKVTNHWVSHGFVCLNKVTHWMPIPQIQKE